MENTVNERIRFIIKDKSMNVTSFSKFIGVTQSVIDSMIKKGTEPSIKTVQSILNAFPLVSIEWLLTGDGEMYKSAPLSITKIHDPKCVEKVEPVISIPLYDIDAAANLHTLLCNKDNNILGNLSIPNMPKCDGAVYVTGDSMYPLLKSGDIVAYKGIELSVMNIIYGEMYLISIDMDGDEYLSVKYIQASEKGEEWIRLVSYNQYHQPKDFPLSAVRAMALVKFSIRINSMR